MIPSSRFLVNSMLKSIDFENARNIVEFGPGTGCMTTEILKRARKDAKLLCFEVNKIFCKVLKKNIKDKRLIIINDDAEKISKYMERYKIKKVNNVISSLPFFNLGEIKKTDIIKETKKVLLKNGKFVFYQYFPHFDFSLDNYFSRISMKFILLNIPPTITYVYENRQNQ